MTGQELLTYKMDKEEQVIWYRFCVDIKNKMNTLNLEPYAYEVLLDKLTKGTPYSYAGGYTQTDGYYYVEAGDRGAWTLIFMTKSYEDAWNQMLKKLAHDMAYKCVVKNMKAVEQKYRHLWRYYEVYDGKEGNRMIYHDVENPNWEYDTKYDYRKYWFEMALHILKRTVSEDVLSQETEQYEELLNRRFSNSYWVYDVEREEFIESV